MGRPWSRRETLSDRMRHGDTPARRSPRRRLGAASPGSGLRAPGGAGMLRDGEVRARPARARCPAPRNDAHGADAGRATVATATALPAASAARAGRPRGRTAPCSRTGHAHRPLPGNRQVRRDRLEIEHLADEGAQRGHQIGGLDGAAGHHVVGRLDGQPHLLPRAQQDHVGERRLDRVADAASPVRAGRAGRIGRSNPIGRVGWRRVRADDGVEACVRDCGSGHPGLLTALPQMTRVDRQVAGEGAAQGLVGRDERLQAFVDLAVLALATLLHALHHQQPDADGHHGHQDEPQQGGQHALPGTEIEGVSHVVSAVERGGRVGDRASGDGHGRCSLEADGEAIALLRSAAGSSTRRPPYSMRIVCCACSMWRAWFTR